MTLGWTVDGRASPFRERRKSLPPLLSATQPMYIIQGCGVNRAVCQCRSGNSLGGLSSSSRCHGPPSGSARCRSSGLRVAGFFSPPLPRATLPLRRCTPQEEGCGTSWCQGSLEPQCSIRRSTTGGAAGNAALGVFCGVLTLSSKAVAVVPPLEVPPATLLLVIFGGCLVVRLFPAL